MEMAPYKRERNKNSYVTWLWHKESTLLLACARIKIVVNNSGATEHFL